MFEWLNDFTAVEGELDYMLDVQAAMHRSKARIAMFDEGRIARIGLKEELSMVEE